MSGPQSAFEAAERALIGSALTWPDVLDDVSISADRFRHPGYKKAWAVLQRLRSEGGAIDSFVLLDALEAEDISLPISDLSAPDAAVKDYAPEYARIVEEGYRRREAQAAIGDALAALRRGERSDDVLGRLVLKAGDISTDSLSSASTALPDLVQERFVQLAELAARKDAGDKTATGIATGIALLDEKLGGLQLGIPTLVGARPGMGKSAFALSITANVTADGVGVHVFSLEDTRQAYMDRVLGQGANVSPEAIRRLELTRDELGQLQATATSMKQRSNWLVDDRAGITALELVRSVRQSAKTNGTKLVIVDYVQLLRPSTNGMRREEHLAESINILGDAAKSDNMAYLVLAQLNRNVENEKRPPLLSDLKSSGALEERAKCIMFLHRPAYYNHLRSRVDWEDPTKLLVYVLKNNQGGVGDLELHWDGERVRVS